MLRFQPESQGSRTRGADGARDGPRAGEDRCPRSAGRQDTKGVRASLIRLPVLLRPLADSRVPACIEEGV